MIANYLHDTAPIPPCTGEPGCDADEHKLCCPAPLNDQETP